MIIFPKKDQKKNFTSFSVNYFSAIKNCYKNIDLSKLKNINDKIIEIVKKKNNVYIAGNGGSASIANHFICDFNKSIFVSTQKKLKPRFFSLSSSPEMITAIANDMNFDEIFSKQLEMVSKKGDALILISCSGNSKNINKAIRVAKKRGVEVMLFCGFKSKNQHRLKYFLNINCKNYGIAEDMFTSIFHIISQFIRFSYSKKKETL